MSLSVCDSIQFLKGVGPRRAKTFAKLGIRIIDDLLYYFPKRYQDWRRLLRICDIKEGEVVTVKGRITCSFARPSWRRKGFNIFEATVDDGSGRIQVVWFNQPYLKEYLKPDTLVVLYGKVEGYAGKLQMNSPEFEIITEGEEQLNVGTILPVYSLAEKFSQRYFRKIVKEALDSSITRLKDPLPYEIRKKGNFLNLAKSLINIHFPQSDELQKEAYRRLCFEEFFLFQIPIIMRKFSRASRRGIIHNPQSKLLRDFIDSLGFRFTESQKETLNEIIGDMSSARVMRRLLQGDVGSGKTVIALCAALVAIDSGWQVAFMVPTEILARQHYHTITGLVDRFRISTTKRKLKIGLMTGGLGRNKRKEIIRWIRQGAVDLVIGTHSLIEKDVKFRRLGLIVIDEQHKFGVAQRALLNEKNVQADTLIMTATPIPRTLAITLYGNLDISTITTLPPGRGKIETRWYPEERRQEVYQLIKSELAKKRQVYIIYPIIDESYTLDLNAAEKMFKELRCGVFSDYRVGLIHGRIKQAEQERVMEEFKAGRIDIIIATTVLEVGIDVPNATVMLIEHADRFGLSQLHQLRGRIGRGQYTSFCLLMGEPKTQEAHLRLQAIVNNNSGFRIAEEDLKIRGPGEFFGSRQHGLSELKIGNPLTQLHLLKFARDGAVRLIKTDPDFTSHQNQELKAVLERRYPGYRETQVVG